MKRVLLFLAMCFLPGAFAVGGSILGNAFGKIGLFAGAVLGGVIGVTAATRIGLWREWIPRANGPRVQVLSLLAFLVAATIAGMNLWTPIIPALSTCIVGVTAVLAAHQRES